MRYNKSGFQAAVLPNSYSMKVEEAEDYGN